MTDQPGNRILHLKTDNWSTEIQSLKFKGLQVKPKKVYYLILICKRTHLLFFEGGNIAKDSSRMYVHNFLVILGDINKVLKCVIQVQ